MSVTTSIYGEGAGGFLKAADLPHGQMTAVYIARTEIRDTNFNNTPGKQIVLTLYGQDKKFGLNRTQARAIEGLYNNEGGGLEKWINKGLYLGRHQTQFNGSPTETILIYPNAFEMPAEMVEHGKQWLAAKDAEAAQSQQAPAFSGPPTGPPAAPPAAPNAFSGPPPAPAEQTGSQFAPPSNFGGNPFSS